MCIRDSSATVPSEPRKEFLEVCVCVIVSMTSLAVEVGHEQPIVRSLTRSVDCHVSSWPRILPMVYVGGGGVPLVCMCVLVVGRCC